MFVCQYLYVQLYLTQFNKPSNKPPARQAKPKVSFVCLQLHVCLFPMSVSLWFLNFFCECLYIMYIDRALVRELCDYGLIFFSCAYHILNYEKNSFDAGCINYAACL